MKKTKFIGVFIMTLCFVLTLYGNVNAINVEFVTKGQPLVDVEYDDLVPVLGNHVLTLESKSNADSFAFHDEPGNRKTINNNYTPGYRYYILPTSNDNRNDGVRDAYGLTKFNGNESFTVRYHNIAKYGDRDVDCLVTIEPRNAGSDAYVDDWITDYEGINYTNYGAIAFHDSFYQGFTYFNTGGTVVKYNLVYSGTSNNIGIKNMYWSWGSVNKPEGISSVDTVNNYYLVNSHDYAHTKFTDFSGSDTSISKAIMAHNRNWSGDSGVWGVGLDAQHCSDTWGVDDFDRTFVGFNIHSDSGIYTFKTLSHDFWFCPFYYPIGATAPDSVKKVKAESQSFWVDSTEVFVGDRIQYKVDQKVENNGQGGTGYMKYTSFKYEDALPREVEYQSARVISSTGSDVTGQGTLAYNSATHTVTFDFSSNFLENGMQYVGETYSLIIDCIVDSDSVEGVAFPNTPKTIINTTVLSNTPVYVTPKYKKVQITLDKVDVETNKVKQGDAKFVHAKYGIYSDSACNNLYEILDLDENGTGVSKVYTVVDFKNGVYTYREDYYIKEITPPEGYLIDEQVYHIHVDRNDITNTATNVRSVSLTSSEKVKRNKIEIIKYLEETVSTPKQHLAGAVFSATLISSIDTPNPKVYYSNPTDDNGYCVIENLPYGNYRIQETTIPDIAWRGIFFLNNETSRRTTFDVFVQNDMSEADPYKYELTDVAKKIRIRMYKEDIETGKVHQGDAHLDGAEYTTYRDADCTDPIETIVTSEQADGSYMAETGLYLSGTYYIKETRPPEGYLIDKTVYKIEQNPTPQNEEVIIHTALSKENVKKSNIHVIKFLNEKPQTDEEPAAGCKLYLTLNSSNGAKVYEAIIDEHGHTSFDDIPYGWYTITESEEARIRGYKLMNPAPVYVKFDATREEDAQDNTLYYVIVGENPIKAYVRVVKEDSETKQRIAVANTEYKIWSYETNDYLTLSTEAGPKDTFKTNDYGYFITPERLKVGRYKLVELTPPEGYHNVDMDFEVPDAVYENIQDVPTVTVTQEDTAQKGKIVVNKKAEVLVGNKQVTDPNTGYEVLQPVYEVKGLPGVAYTITAVEDVVTGDGRVHMHAGDSITILTEADGVAQTDWLYLGKYTVKETATPTGYVLNTEEKEITLDYRTSGRDEEGRLVVAADYTVSTNYTNERVKIDLQFDKKYGNTVFNNITDIQKNRVKFGVYAAEDIRGYNGQVVFPKDSLLEVILVKNAKGKVTVDLPVGQYYLQEINVKDLPFIIDTTKYNFEFAPSNRDNVGTVTINNGNPINNPPFIVTETFLKINTKVYNAHKAEIDRMIANKEWDRLEELSEEYGLEGAVYQVYYKDENGKYQKLQTQAQNGEWEDVQFTSGENGLDIKNLPVGKYYLKEVTAPVDYEVDPNYVELNVNEDRMSVAIVHDPKIQGKITVIHKDIDTDEVIYPFEISEDDIDEPYSTVDRETEINKAYGAGFDIYELVEEKIPENKDGVYQKEEQTIVYYYKRLKGKLTVIKTDAETSERLPGCIFTIQDKMTGKVLVENAETDENGEWVMEKCPYGVYVFTEIEAPEGYVIEDGCVGAEFSVRTAETIFEIVNTGDIAVYALAGLAVVCILGIVFVIVKKAKK